MDERLFQRLCDLLCDRAVVLASVIDTRGATPRKRDSRMLITAAHSEFSIGGGMAEARVIEAAHALLNKNAESAEMLIDLSGRPGAAGVCGGQMELALRRWQGEADRLRASAIAAQLAMGEPVALNGSDLGSDQSALAAPDPRLLIVGGGHCAAALCDLAAFIGFDLWVHDVRADCLQSPSFASCTRLCGPFDQLSAAFDTRRDVLVVLLNRDFGSDVATLRAIAAQRPGFLGMMGSRRRIAEVLAALPDQPDLASRLHAPIGLEIGAHTPHEIAISILAQLIEARPG